MSMSLRWLLPFFLTLSVFAKAAPLDVSFSCLWWSPEQITGINMASPPPKTTEIDLKKWDYSDPAGTPNPDTVFVKVKAPVELSVPQAFTATIEYRFRVAKMGKKAAAKWQSVKKLSPAKVEISPTKLNKVGEVAIKPVMDELFKTDQWPYELEVKVKLATADGKTTYEGKGILPITPGD